MWLDNQPGPVVPGVPWRSRRAAWWKLSACCFSIDEVHAPGNFRFLVQTPLILKCFLSKFITIKFINPESAALRFYFSLRLPILRSITIRFFGNNSGRLRAKKYAVSLFPIRAILSQGKSGNRFIRLPFSSLCPFKYRKNSALTWLYILFHGAAPKGSARCNRVRQSATNKTFRNG